MIEDGTFQPRKELKPRRIQENSLATNPLIDESPKDGVRPSSPGAVESSNLRPRKQCRTGTVTQGLAKEGLATTPVMADRHTIAVTMKKANPSMDPLVPVLRSEVTSPDRNLHFMGSL